MKSSNVRVKQWHVAMMMAALVVGCSADQTGVSGPKTDTAALVSARTGAILTNSAAVDLGTAGDFVILSKSGISTVPQSVITGNIGVSPIARGGMTGFSETMDGTNSFSTSGQVVGKMFAADYSGSSPSNLGIAVLDMQAAYTNAAGRAPDYTEVGAGDIGGMTLSPGTYKWSTGVLIPADVTLNGGPNDVWIFQIAGTVTQASGTRVTLTGGAQARNIFWQVADVVALNTTAHMEGIILAQTGITLATGATVNGRLLAQTAVTLQMNVVTQPYTGAILTNSAAVDLGTAGDFVILSKSGISTVPQSVITGNIGVSPIARGGMTGFSETMDGTNSFSTSGQVVGKMFAADYSGSSPSNLGIAVLDMQAAYTNAAGRAPDYTEVGAGDIGGMTLSPGTYKWSTGVLIPADVTLNGGPNDVWIFQIAGTVTQASGTRVTLTGGAQARNIFWQVADVVALNTTAHMEGIILAQTGITLATGATVNGRLLAQTAVTLQMNVVTQP